MTGYEERFWVKLKYLEAMEAIRIFLHAARDADDEHEDAIGHAEGAWSELDEAGRFLPELLEES